MTDAAWTAVASIIGAALAQLPTLIQSVRARAEVRAMKNDTARGFQDTGRRMYELKDELGTVRGVQQAHGQMLAAASSAPGYYRDPRLDDTPLTRRMPHGWTPGFSGSAHPPPAVPPLETHHGPKDEDDSR